MICNFKELTFALLLPAILLVFSPLCSNGQALRLPTFEMEDQWGSTFSSTQFKDSWLVVMVADRVGSSFSPDLGRALRSNVLAKHSSVQFSVVANVYGAPRLVRSLIRRKVRSTNDTPVLLDWSGIFQSSFSLSSQSVEILLFSPEGILRLQSTQYSFDPTNLEGIGQQISTIVSQND